MLYFKLLAISFSQIQQEKNVVIPVSQGRSKYLKGLQISIDTKEAWQLNFSLGLQATALSLYLREFVMTALLFSHDPFHFDQSRISASIQCLRQYV